MFFDFFLADYLYEFEVIEFLIRTLHERDLVIYTAFDLLRVKELTFIVVFNRCLRFKKNLIVPFSVVYGPFIIPSEGSFSVIDLII
jgi:hypothetical protein